MRFAPPSKLRVAAVVATVVVFAVGCAASKPVSRPEDAGALTLVAEVALERGDCRGAAETYASAAEATTEIELIKRAFEVALTCEQLEPAARIAQRWRAVAPGDLDAARFAGVVELKLGRVRAARESFEAALADADGDEPLLELVPIAVSEADAYKAYAAFKGFARESRWDAPAIVTLAGVAADAYDFRSARRLVHDAIDRDAQSAAAHALEARILAAENEGDNAVAAAQEAMALDADLAAFALAEVLTSLGRHEEAFRELERLQRDPSTAGEADRRLALLAFSQGDDEEATMRFASRLRRGEGPAEALYYLGALAERGGDPDQALEYYGRLASASASIYAVARAASVLAHQGERDAALRLLDDHATEHPTEIIDVIATKVSLLGEIGATGESVALVDAALELFPGHPDLRYQRAFALEQSGRIEEAVDAFESLLGEQPDDPALLNALGYTLADHHRELGRAESLIRRALEHTPDNPAVLDSLAWVKFRRGRTQESLEPFERAWRLSQDAEIAAHWGEALWSLDRVSEARAVWARALARDPSSEPLKETIARFITPTTTP